MSENLEKQCKMKFFLPFLTLIETIRREKKTENVEMPVFRSIFFLRKSSVRFRSRCRGLNFPVVSEGTVENP